MAEARIQTVDLNLFTSLIERARQSPRRRTNHNFHAAMDENAHRFLNVLLRGTYITPHRHLNPPKAESLLVLHGRAVFFTFDSEGRVASKHILGGGTVGIDIDPGIWHTVAVLGDEAVCYEVKSGPYAATNDKEFAPWAPREGDPAVPAYLDRLLEGL